MPFEIGVSGVAAQAGALRAKLCRIRDLVAVLSAQHEAALALHVSGPVAMSYGDENWCVTCEVASPCPTAVALGA